MAGRAKYHHYVQPYGAQLATAFSRHCQLGSISMVALKTLLKAKSNIKTYVLSEENNIF